MSWTRVIFSERIRSMGGKFSMNFSMVLNFPGKQTEIGFFFSFFFWCFDRGSEFSFRSETDSLLFYAFA